MNVTVPFHLRRLNHSQSAAGLLLQSDSVRDLLEVCKSLRHVNIFATASGFLLLADDIPAVMPKCLKLRSICENGYLPADADLLPSLTKTEAADLTRQQGLVFMPGGKLLAFDPTEPRRPTDFLKMPPLRRHQWQAFPEVETPASELRGIELPPPPPGEPLLPEPEGEPIGGEDPRPADASLGKKVLGKSTHALGAGLGALGKLIGNDGLAKFGDKLKDKAIEMAPRLTESILGKQEAALQELLRKFKQGNIEEALKRAIPFSNNPGRGSKAHTGTNLPTNNLGFSLANIFGNSNQSGGVWHGGQDDTWRKLAEEYRRAAKEAFDRGDYRRAAMIHAKLLGDFRTAADVLSKGGLHREAARVFRDKVADWNRAALEFEKAGDFDEALNLYLKSAEFEKAGDLYRRMGEEEKALEQYHQAAERIIQLHKDYVKAGELMLRKTGQANLAGAYFALGWQRRENSGTQFAGALDCGIRLLEIYAYALPRETFWTHIQEAEEWLNEGANRKTEAAVFFNKLTALAELSHLQAERSAIRDRALVALARQLRFHSEYERNPGNIVSTMFGQQPHWKPELVSDASFALKSAMNSGTRKINPNRQTRKISLGDQTIVAVASATSKGTLFVGFEDSSIVAYDPSNDYLMKIEPPSNDGKRILGLAARPDAGVLALLFATREGEIRLTWYEANGGTYKNLSWTRIGSVYGECQLVQVFAPQNSNDATQSSGTLVLLEIDGATHSYELPSFMHLVDCDRKGRFLDENLHFLLSRQVDKKAKANGVTDHKFADFYFHLGRAKLNLGWQPSYLGKHGEYSFRHLSCLLVHAHQIEFCGVDSSGILHFSEVQMNNGTPTPRHLSSSAPGGYRGALLLKSGRLAAVTFSNQVQWLKVFGEKLVESATPTQLSSAYRSVGCFLSPATEEVIVVMGNGEAFFIPIPT